MTSNTRLILASDVDKTLLLPHESLEGELLVIISKLLSTEKIWFAILTDNDYMKITRKTVVQTLQRKLRKNLVVYADGCTRKIIYNSNGDELPDLRYHKEIEFDVEDKRNIEDLLRAKIEEWGMKYPGLYSPDVDIELTDSIQVKIGPINVNTSENEKKRNTLQKIIVKKLEKNFLDVQIIPSDKLWIRFHCRNKSNESSKLLTISNIIKNIVESEEFNNLSRPTIVDRGRQLAVKPIKQVKIERKNKLGTVFNHSIREILIKDFEKHISENSRCTKKEYWPVITGRTTINIQRRGVNKAYAVRDLMSSLEYQGEVIYFGDEFGKYGGDRPIASVKGVQSLCVSEVDDIPQNVIRIPGGVFTTKSYLKGILWALTGHSK